MHIESVTIANYKSFLEKQTIHLEPGFNLLLGTNNAGKTSVLDVMDMDIGLNEPHRSERTIPKFGGQPNPRSEFEVTLATHFQEIWKLLGGAQMYLPIQKANFHENDVLKAVALFIGSNQRLQIICGFGQGFDSTAFIGDTFVRGTTFRNNAVAIDCALIQYVPNNPNLQIQLHNGSLNSTTATYGQLFRQRIYRFSAQRRPGFQCGAQDTAVLDREAVTLPYCINHLQTNDAHGHRILCGWVNRVFPSVKWIQATPNGGSFELRCLPMRAIGIARSSLRASGSWGRQRNSKIPPFGVA